MLLPRRAVGVPTVHVALAAVAVAPEEAEKTHDEGRDHGGADEADNDQHPPLPLCLAGVVAVGCRGAVHRSLNKTSVTTGYKE